jgi:hypothetical protein
MQNYTNSDFQERENYRHQQNSSHYNHQFRHNYNREDYKPTKKDYYYHDKNSASEAYIQRAPLQTSNENRKDSDKKTFKHNPPKINKYYKTHWCKKLREKMQWPDPSKWNYAHSKEELRKVGDDFPIGYLQRLQVEEHKYYNDHYALYKTSLCKAYMDGAAWKYGEAWNYAHSESELRSINTPLTNQHIIRINLNHQELKRIHAEIQKNRQQRQESYENPLPSPTTYIQNPTPDIPNELPIPTTPPIPTSSPTMTPQPSEPALPISLAEDLVVVPTDFEVRRHTIRILEKVVGLIEQNYYREAADVLMDLQAGGYIKFVESNEETRDSEYVDLRFMNEKVEYGWGFRLEIYTFFWVLAFLLENWEKNPWTWGLWCWLAMDFAFWWFYFLYLGALWTFVTLGLLLFDTIINSLSKTNKPKLTLKRSFRCLRVKLVRLQIYIRFAIL